MNNLDAITASIDAQFEVVNQRRDSALNQSRGLIRQCSSLIRTVHKQDWEGVDKQMAELHTAAEELHASVEGYPELIHTGYTQDAFKEYAEAILTLALVRGDDELPTPEALNVLPSTYLNGLAEAASEMRRYVLNLLRDGNMDESKRLLGVMDTVYDVLFSFGYPDAVTGGLRRRVDQLRGVVERTRGDVTTTVRQDRLLAAMRDLESRLNIAD